MKLTTMEEGIELYADKSSDMFFSPSPSYTEYFLGLSAYKPLPTTKEGKLRIGIFGGSFDPLHIGHLHLIETARQKLGLNKIIFVPTKISVYPDKVIQATAKQRLHMLTEVVLDLDKYLSKYDIDDIELKRKKPSYTIDIGKYFREKYPEKKTQLILIFGADIYGKLTSFKDYDMIGKYVDGMAFANHNFPCLELNIRSSIVRQKVKQGETISYLVPKQVESYIYHHKLYKEIGGETTSSPGPR